MFELYLEVNKKQPEDTIGNERMEQVKINNPLSGETFKLLLNSKQFSGCDEIYCNEIKMRVIKVYPLTWWKKILMKFGWEYKSMELEVVDEEYELWRKTENEKNKFIPDGI